MCVREETSKEMPLLFNILCLITKKYIHLFKYRNKIPDERGLIWNIIYPQYGVWNCPEKRQGGYIIRCHKMAKFNKKWLLMPCILKSKSGLSNGMDWINIGISIRDKVDNTVIC